MAAKIWVGITTVASEKEAKLIAQNLISQNLVACVNIIRKIKSFFYWQGKFCAEDEVLLFMKTMDKKVDQVIKEIKRFHSYEVPEIIFWEVKKSEENYQEWVKESIRGQKKIK